jgi:signal transduction histidine kinase
VTSAQAANVRVLLIEDNAGDARLIAEYFSESPVVRFALTRVARLDAAIAKLAEGVFDVVLLDLSLPDARGLEALKGIRAAAGAIPIVILTGSDAEEIGMRAMQEGAQDYLVKGEPASGALVRTVRYAIERQQTVRRLRETEAQLGQAQKMEAIGRLAGGVAHDFNNILTAILGLAELALGSLPKDSAVTADIVEIRKAAQRAAALTHQLLDFSRRQIIIQRPVRIDVLLLELAKMLRRILGEHVTLDVKTEAGVPMVKADAGQLEQVIVNLAVNARDAMPQGGRLTIRISPAEITDEEARAADVPSGQYLLIEVSDTGAGISAEVQSHMFEPFFTTKEAGKGTGLGLATSYGIIRNHGGGITCSSVVGSGTTFRMLLPSLSTTTSPEEQAAVDSSPASAGSEALLLVEDDEELRRLTARMLRRLGYDVLEATDGARAMEHLAQDSNRRLRLIITDVVMPVMNGWELSRRVSVIRPELPLLFMTGYTDEQLQGICILDSKVRILAKPFTTSELAKNVRDALRS